LDQEIRELFNREANHRLERDALEARIADFLATHNMCVLATCRENLPQATPIEYYADRLTLYMIVDPGTKLEYMKVNPNVSIGIHDPLTGWRSIRGLQIFGRATLIYDDQPEYDAAMQIYDWRFLGGPIGASEAPRGHIMARVDPVRIKLTEFTLKEHGYAPTQVWKAAPCPGGGHDCSPGLRTG